MTKSDRMVIAAGIVGVFVVLVQAHMITGLINECEDLRFENSSLKSYVTFLKEIGCG